MRSEEMYPFVSTDADEVDADVAAIYTDVTGKARARGVDLMFCQILSRLVLYCAANTNFAANQNLASRASGANLDALGQIYYEQSRPAATYAGVMIKFTLSEAQGSAVIVPAGTRVTDMDNSIFFATDEDLTIAAGDTDGSIHATCTEIGTPGNGYAIGDLCVCVDTFPYYDSCENTDVSGGGGDVPDDDEFYALLVASQDAYSAGGAEGSYIYFAEKAVPTLADVVVNSPNDGEVRIYCLLDTGVKAGAEEKALVLAACDAKEHRPLTDKVIVSDPGEVSYTINLTYYVPAGATASVAQVQSAVTNAVNEYVAWQSGKLGRDIVPDELISRIIGAGAKRFVITTPVYTVLQDGTIPTNYDPDTDLPLTVPQIAKCTSITLTYGGIENE